MARSANNLNAVLQDTADAIKAKKGSSSKICPRDFADEIAGITSGTTPTGTKRITVNGIHDVTNYASADVDVHEEIAVGLSSSQCNTISSNISTERLFYAYYSGDEGFEPHFYFNENFELHSDDYFIDVMSSQGGDLDIDDVSFPFIADKDNHKIIGRLALVKNSNTSIQPYGNFEVFVSGSSVTEEEVRAGVEDWYFNGIELQDLEGNVLTIISWDSVEFYVSSDS